MSKVFNWSKLGRVFHTGQVTDKWWMKSFSQTPSALVFDEYIRIYFCCRPEIDEQGQYVSYLAYIDLNRGNPLEILRISNEPLLGLGDTGMFDEFGIYPASIVKYGSSTRVYYGGNTRCKSVPFNAAIGVAESFDGGETFSRIGPGPILSYSLDEPFVLGSPKIRVFNNKWYLWYSAGREWINESGYKQPVYKIRYAVSDDGLNWTKTGKNILPDVLEVNECQASADVIFAKGKYHMFFSYRYNLGYKEKGRGYRIGYAHSNDLETWQREDSRAGLYTAESGWDSESVSYAHLFEMDGFIYALYQGNYMGKDGIGLAKLSGELL